MSTQQRLPNPLAVVVVAGVLVVCVRYFACSSNTVSLTGDAMSTSISLLSRAFRNNGVGAEREYKDKVIELSGEVQAVSTDVVGTPYVILIDGNDELQAYFNDRSAVADLRKGQQITIRGRCGTMTLGTVTVHDCVTVNPDQGRASVANADTPHYSHRPFDVTTWSVGANFMGHSARGIEDGLKADWDAHGPRTKSEFESRAAYERRTAWTPPQQIIEGVSLNSELAFLVHKALEPFDLFVGFHGSSHFDYDAEKQAFIVQLDIRTNPTWIPNTHGIFTDEISLLTFSKRYLSSMTWQLPMPVSEARDFKGTGRLLLVCSLTEPWFDGELRCLRVKPEQVWVINGSTGKVLQKYDISRKSLVNAAIDSGPAIK